MREEREGGKTERDRVSYIHKERDGEKEVEK